MVDCIVFVRPLQISTKLMEKKYYQKNLCLTINHFDVYSLNILTKCKGLQTIPKKSNFKISGFTLRRFRMMLYFQV